MTGKVIFNINEGEEAKFIYGTTKDQEVVCALPLNQYGFHREIYQKLKSEEISLEKVSGGFVQNESDRIILHGSSESYGQAPMEHVKELLEEETGKEVVYKRDKDFKQEKRERKFQEVLGNFESELEREAYRAVYDLGTRAGYDYMQKPVTTGDCSLIIFSTENGSSFGFDTLWLNYNGLEGMITKPISYERGYIQNNSIKANQNGNELDISYSSSDGIRNLQIPLYNLENYQPASHLSSIDEELKRMYEQKQEIYKGTEVTHI